MKLYENNHISHQYNITLCRYNTGQHFVRYVGLKPYNRINRIPLEIRTYKQKKRFKYSFRAYFQENAQIFSTDVLKEEKREKELKKEKDKKSFYQF